MNFQPGDSICNKYKCVLLLGLPKVWETHTYTHTNTQYTYIYTYKHTHTCTNRSKLHHRVEHHFWLVLTIQQSFLIGCGTSRVCSFTPYLLGVKAVIATHKLAHAHAGKHAKNTSIDCQAQSPQSVLYIHAAGTSKSKEGKEREERRRERERERERCQAVIYDLKRQINSTGCLTGPETSWITAQTRRRGEAEKWRKNETERSVVWQDWEKV